MALTKKQMKMREAVRKFCQIYLDHRFERGAFDETVKHFLNGDSLTINLNIDLIANDWLFMNLLIDGVCPDDVIKKLKEKWNEEW